MNPEDSESASRFPELCLRFPGIKDSGLTIGKVMILKEQMSFCDAFLFSKLKVLWCKPAIEVAKVPYCVRFEVDFLSRLQEKRRFGSPNNLGPFCRAMVLC